MIHLAVDMHKNNTQQSAFSIIEVIVFASMLSIVLVAAVAYTVRLVFTMTHDRHKLLATHYVEEMHEWLNGERESDWEQFQNYSSTTGTTYCINDPLNLSRTLASLSTGLCGFTGVGTASTTNPLIFQRQLILLKDRAKTATKVTATVRVSWRDEGVLYSEEIVTVYSVWE